MAEFQPIWNEDTLRGVIKQYDSNPAGHPEKLKQLIAQHAQYYNVPFYEGDFSIGDAIADLGRGFAEGFTTLNLFDPPDNEYEAIFRNIGHLAGFAPGIIGAPLGAAAKLTKSAGLLNAAKMARKLNDKSVPMMFANFATRQAKKVAKPLLAQGARAKTGAVNDVSNFLLGHKAKHMAEGAFHLGAASAISSWQGGVDQMMSSFLHGGLAGGVFRGIGNFVKTGSESGDKIAKALSGSLFMGIPATMRGATTPEQVYEYMLGAWFGGKEMPWTVAKAGKFIKRFEEDALGTKDKKGNPELQISMDPEMHPEFKKLPVEVQPVVKEMAEKTWGNPLQNLAANYFAATEAGIDLDLGKEAKGFEQLAEIKKKVGVKGKEPNFILTGGGLSGANDIISTISRLTKDKAANIHILTPAGVKSHKTRKTPGFTRIVEKAELEEANEAVREANLTLKRYAALSKIKPKQLDAIRKNYFIVKNADAVFLVGRVMGNRNQLIAPTKFGVEWAHQMSVNNKKPTYIYDTKTSQWMQWKKGTVNGFVPIKEPPKPPKALAIIGEKVFKQADRDAIQGYFTQHFKPAPKKVKAVKQIEDDDINVEGVNDSDPGVPVTSKPQTGDKAQNFVFKYMSEKYKDEKIAPLKASKMSEDITAIKEMLPEYINRGEKGNQYMRFLNDVQDKFNFVVPKKRMQEVKDDLRQWINRRNTETPLEFIEVNNEKNEAYLMDKENPITQAGNRKPNMEVRKVSDFVWNEMLKQKGRAYQIIDHISIETSEGIKDIELSQFRKGRTYENMGKKRYDEILSKAFKDLANKNDVYYFGGNGTADRLIMMKYHPEINKISDSVINTNFKSVPRLRLRRRFTKKFAHKNGMKLLEAQKYFDKAYKSNVLWHLSMNGMAVTPDNIKKITSKGFINNVKTWNKRSQIWMTDGFAGEKEFYKGKITDLSKNGNFKYMIVEDLSDYQKKLNHEDISLLSTENPEHIDGAIIARRDVLKRINEDAGNSADGITQSKSFIVSPHQTRGALLGKYGMHDSGKTNEAAMKKEGIHFIIQESAAKQMGLREFGEVYEDLSPEHIKHSYTVRQTNESAMSPQSLKKQILGNLVSHLAFSGGKRMQDVTNDIFENFIQPRYKGNTKVNEKLDKYYESLADEKLTDTQLRNELDKINFEELGIDKIVEGLKIPGNQLFARKVYDLAFKSQRSDLEDRMESGELEESNYAEELAKIEDFHSIQQRMLREGEKYAEEKGKPQNMIGIYGHVNIADYRMQVMNNWIVKQATQPKIFNSGSARIRPYDQGLLQDIDNTNKRLKSLNKDDTLFFLDNQYKKMNIKTDITGMEDITLGKLWKMYEGGNFNKQPNIKKKVEQIFRSAVMRVPMDSPSGTQILKFSGFTGREGHGVLMHSRAMRALGGADLDGDVAYFYMGGKGAFKDSWKDAYEANKEEFYKKGKKITTIEENKSQRFEDILTKQFSKKEKALLDSPEAMFSPESRMLMSEAAVEGRNLLGGAAVMPKQIMASVYNALVEKKKDNFVVKRKRKNPKTKKWGIEEINIEIRPKTKVSDKKYARALGRAMVGFASDPMDYAGLTGYKDWYQQLYNAHFDIKITGYKGPGKKKMLDAKKFKTQAINEITDSLGPYELKNGGIYKTIHDANSAFYGRNYSEAKKWTMEEQMEMTRKLITDFNDKELNTMTPKIGRMLSQLDYSDTPLDRINPDKIGELYKVWKETPASYKALLRPLGRTSFKVLPHVYIEASMKFKLNTFDGRRDIMNDNNKFDALMKLTGYDKIEEHRREISKDNKAWYYNRQAVLTDIKNKANAFIVKDLVNMDTNKATKEIIDTMSPKERKSVEDISKSVDYIKKRSYLMRRARNKYKSKSQDDPANTWYEEMVRMMKSDPELKKLSNKISFIKESEEPGTAYLDQNTIDNTIANLKRTKYTTAKQQKLFDTLLLGSLNRVDLEVIDAFEKTLGNKMTKIQYDVLSSLRREAARTSMTKVGFASRSVSDKSVREAVGRYSELFDEASINRSDAIMKKQAELMTNEPQKPSNIKKGLPEVPKVMQDLQEFLARTTGLESLGTKGKEAYEKGLLDSDTKSAISDVITHLKTENHKVTENLPELVRALRNKDFNVMNKQDWKFMKNWFDDIKRGTLWQRLKKGDMTKLSQRHYMQFPETINRELMKDEIVLMQEKGLFLTADGVYATGPVRRPTQYMDLMQEAISRTGDEAVALGERYTNELSKDLTFIQDLSDMQSLHDIAIRLREKPLANKIRERIQRKESDENFVDADEYDKAYKDIVESTDYENSIKNREYTVSRPNEAGKIERIKMTGEEVVNEINNTYTKFFKKMHRITTGDVLIDKDGNAITHIPESLSKYYASYWDKGQFFPKIDSPKFVRDMAKRWQDGKSLSLDFGLDGLGLVAKSMMVEMTKDPKAKNAFIRKLNQNEKPFQTGKIDFENYWPHMHFSKKEALESLKAYAEKLQNSSSMDETVMQKLLSKLTYRNHALTGDWNFEDMDGWSEWDLAQATINKKLVEKEQRINWFNPNIKSGSQFSRESHLPGWSIDAVSASSYAKNIFNAYHRQMAQIMSRNYIGEFSNKMRKKFGDEQTNAWTNFMKLWVQGATGSPDVIPEHIMNDRAMSIKNTPFSWFADNVVKDRMNSIADKIGVLKKDLPENMRGIDIHQLRYLSNLEAKFQLASLLAHPKAMVNNIFGGQAHTIGSVGFKTWKDARNIKVLSRINQAWDSKQKIDDFVTGHGVTPEYMQHEYGLKTEMQSAKNKQFIDDIASKVRRDPSMSSESVIDIGRKANIAEPVLKWAAKFMSIPERALRRDAFMSHYLFWYNKFGGSIKDLNHPILIRLAKKGVQGTQFLYNAPNRPMFARTALGKVMTRFQLWGWNAVRFRKDALNQAKLYGFRGAELDRAARIMQMDLFMFAMGNMFAYSLFETAMPAPWNWMQDTSELLFGDEKARDRAFFGQWPRAIAPLQAITPPIASMPMAAMRAVLEDDWSRVADYYIYTMSPFGRILRDFVGKRNLMENPMGVIDKWTGIPLQQLGRESKKIRGEDRYIPSPGMSLY